MTYSKDLLLFHSQIRMSQLEVKEKELNKLKQESDQLVLNQHPASDKIEVGFMRFIFLSGEERGHFSKIKTIQETKKTIQMSSFCPLQSHDKFIYQHPRPGIGKLFLERIK